MSQPPAQLQPLSTAAAAAAAAAADAAPDLLRQEKRALRKSMARVLSAITREETVSQSAAVADRVLASRAWHRSHAVSVYVSMEQGEVCTDALCRAALEQGKRLYVPLFGSGGKMGQMRMLHIHTAEEFHALQPNKWGIREPEEHYHAATHPTVHRDGPMQVPRDDPLLPTSAVQGLDLIVVPGVAFDHKCRRLGHGKGYYDRYITATDVCRKAHGQPRVHTLALALAPQLLPPDQCVPTEAHDHVLDAIAHPAGWVSPTSGL